jgi:hypothetical protein
LLDGSSRVDVIGEAALRTEVARCELRERLGASVLAAGESVGRTVDVL